MRHTSSFYLFVLFPSLPTLGFLGSRALPSSSALLILPSSQMHRSFYSLYPTHQTSCMQQFGFPRCMRPYPRKSPILIIACRSRSKNSAVCWVCDDAEGLIRPARFKCTTLVRPQSRRGETDSITTTSECLKAFPMTRISSTARLGRWQVF